MTVPALPPGFVLENQQGIGSPQLPPGFELIEPQADFSGVTTSAESTADTNGGADPTEGMGQYQKYRAGLGESMVNTYEGIKQLGTDAARYFVQENPRFFDQRSTGSLVSGKDDSTLGKIKAIQQQQYADQAERQRINEPLNRTGMGMAGNVIGTAAQILGPGMALRGTAAGATFLPRTVAGNALQGGAVGAMQPVTGEGQRARNAAFGTVASAAGAGVPKVLGAGVNMLARLSPALTQGAQQRAAANVLNQFASDPAALRLGATPPQQIVPGSLPTLAEASGDVGLAGLQRTLANTPDFGNQLAGRQTANNAARVAHIEGNFGGADTVAADAARSVRDVMARRTLSPARALPMNGLDKVTAGVERMAEKHQAAPAVREAMAAVQAELPNIKTVGDAHAVRQYIGQLIGGQVEGKAGAKLAKRELMTVQTLLDREMRNTYPEWGAFLRDYKAMSREADQIDVGAELLNTGRAVRGATNEPVLSPAGFARAAGNLDRTVQRATGFKRASADRTLTPDQLKAVDAVRQDLERYSRATVDGKAIGSNTMQNAIGGSTFQSAVGPVGAAMVEPVSGIALLAVNQLRKSYGAKVASIVEEAMLDPQRAAEILATLPARQRAQVVRQVAGLIPRVSGTAAVVGTALAE